MALLTACGKWDYSREAMKAANGAQGENVRVTFDTSRELANALRDATEKNVQPADVTTAMQADESLDELLTGARLDVIAVESSDADEAADAIAQQITTRGLLSGKKSGGYIAMIKADNGYFYAAVVTYRTGGSGGSSGSGSGNSGNGSGGSTGSDDGNNPGGGTDPGTDPDEGGDEPETKYTVTWGTPANGSITVKAGSNEIASGTEVPENTVLTITATPDAGYELNEIQVNSSPLSGNTYTVTSKTVITASFVKEAAPEPISSAVKVEQRADHIIYTDQDVQKDDLKVTVTYTYADGATTSIELKNSDFYITGTNQFADAGNKSISIVYNGQTYSGTIEVKEAYVTSINFKSGYILYRDANDTFFCMHVFTGMYEPYTDLVLTLTYSNARTVDIDCEQLDEMAKDGRITVINAHTNAAIPYEKLGLGDTSPMYIKIQYKDDNMSSPVQTAAQIVVHIDKSSS